MALSRPWFSLPLLAALLLVAAGSAPSAVAAGVFQVRRKFPGGVGGDGGASALRAHNSRRHLRLDGSADLPLGGLAKVTGLYFTEIKLGTPPKSYHVQVDTGSDKLEVNCISCKDCPQKSQLGFHLVLYDPEASSSGGIVYCDQEFCTNFFGSNQCNTSAQCPVSNMCNASAQCPEYANIFDDGSRTVGFFVNDALQFDQVSGDGQTEPTTANIIFGCVTEHAGHWGSSNQGTDGIIGFGRANTSLLSQLAAAGKVKKVFAHCLDGKKGGGIFAIGDVVQPKVKTTPLRSDVTSYIVNLTSIDVDGTTLHLPAHVFGTGALIDSGSTLTNLPKLVFQAVMDAVFKHKNISLYNDQGFFCFHNSGSAADGFPTITFHFEDDLPLHVYPHEYFISDENDKYCMGFQNAASRSSEDNVIMGDLVLSNKLVVYDVENSVIGWTDYDCSSSIKIKDDKTGTTYTVNSHNISSGWKLQWHKSLVLLVTMACSYLIR